VILSSIDLRDRVWRALCPYQRLSQTELKSLCRVCAEIKGVHVVVLVQNAVVF